MEILKTINNYAQKEGLLYLLAGGHAINAIGFTRNTGDLDLIVKISQLEAWQQLLQGLGYKIFQKSQSSCRFHPPKIAEWPIDFMIVDELTFGKLLTTGSIIDFGGVSCTIPSISHLIAMKLHALKNDFEGRKEKDISDIIKLRQIDGSKLDSPKFEEIINKHGSKKALDEIKRRTQE